MKHDVHTMSHLKTTLPGCSLLTAALILFVGAPIITFAQDDSGNFFEGFSKPFRNISPNGEVVDVTESTVEQAPPPAVEQLAVQLLADGQAHPSQNIHTELTDAEAYNKFLRTNRSRLSTILETGEFSPDAVKVIDESLEQMLYSLTVQEHLKSDESNKIYQEIYRYFISKAGNNLPPVQRQTYREQIFARMLPFLEKLLQQNYFVRLRIAILLSDLDLKQGDSRNGISPIPYRGAVELALKTIASQDQPEAVKICCLRSVNKGLMYGDFSKSNRVKIAALCIDELLEKANSWWYQRELVKTLEKTNVDVDDQGLPFIAHALTLVLSDPTRKEQVRSQAAHALGRITYTPAMQINFELISYEILNFTISMAEKRNTLIKEYGGDGAKVPPAFMSHWGMCFGNAYLAYQPQNKDEKQAGAGLLIQTSRPGMGQHATQIKETYARIHPFFNFLLDETHTRSQFPDALIDSGKEWLREYPPSDLKVAPNTKPLVGLQTNPENDSTKAATAAR
ncbi:MAG: hypothetical protein KDA65_11190 [Planctomycetaceae bacterium]|nr:hypothetical protein [Planctomycetaceae bacterium]